MNESSTLPTGAIKLVSWNVNGLRSIVSKNFSSLIQDVCPDVLCLQETKIHYELSMEFGILLGSNHQSSFNCADKKGYSGVATFVDKRLLGGQRDLPEASMGSGEGRILASSVGPYTLYNIYFPSGTSGEDRQDYKYKFLDAIYEHLSDLSPSQRSNLIICGDFNICHRDIDIHHPREAERRGLSGFLPEERKWMDMFCDLGFIDTFRLVHGPKESIYSWWTYRAGARAKNLGWRIDYFFVSKELKDMVVGADILTHVGGSDHCPVTLEMKIYTHRE